MTSTLFITGATSGFGAATARRFAKDGWSLIITGRREDRLSALAEELSAHTKVHPIVLDVRDRAAVEAAVNGLPEEFSTLRGLVNNAGWPWVLHPLSSAIWMTGTPWSIPISRVSCIARACYYPD